MNGMRVKILKNEIGAVYENIVWDRFLKVETITGDTIEIFDPEAISNNLQEGIACELLCCADILNNSNGIKITGKIIENDWLHTSLKCHKISKILRNDVSSWSILQSTFGNLAIRTNALKTLLGQPITVNDRITCYSDRIDVLAICTT